MRSGKAIRLVIYADREKALRAAGIDPGEAGSRRSLPQDPERDQAARDRQ